MNRKLITATIVLVLTAGIGACDRPYEKWDGVKAFASTLEATPTATSEGITCTIPNRERQKISAREHGYESAECFPAEYQTGSGEHIGLIVAVNNTGDNWNRDFPLHHGTTPERGVLKNFDESWQVTGKLELLERLQEDLGGDIE